MEKDVWGKPLEKDEFYWDERGFRVFTEKYLLKRGYCCKNNCKHCPYGFSKNKNQTNLNSSK